MLHDMMQIKGDIYISTQFNNVIMIEDIIGYLGGFFIMISFIPQVIKSYKTKSVGDLSIEMIIITLIGTVFWITYGFLIDRMPIIVMNSVFGVIVLYQLYLKITYER